jgi:Cu/Ag efflux protein CusF
MLGSTILLAACGPKAETNEMAAANTAVEATGNMAEMPGNMGNMAMPAEGAAKMAKGSGTVTAIDKAAGTITLDHGPIPEASWPAMTMAFQAKPALLDSVKVGDKVAFDLALKDGAGEVTAVQKQ